MSLFTRRDIFALAIIGLCSRAFGQDSRNGYYSNSTIGPLRPVVAKSGMLVAQERIAAEIGRDVLARGGNAIDAAVATGFAMAVTYPRAGNIGGGGFMIVHLASSGQDIALDYRETAPAAATP